MLNYQKIQILFFGIDNFHKFMYNEFKKENENKEEFIMRKIINGRTYNTETSRVIGIYQNGYSRSDFNYYEETLYCNTKGAYFLHGVGGAMSKYSRNVGGNTFAGGEEIIPLTLEEAQEWAEKHLEVEEYEAEFGECEEAENDLVNRERVNFSLDNEIVSNLRKLSKHTGTPMSQMVDRAIMALYGEKFKQLAEDKPTL